jgi:copper(I)-binding protein
MWKFVLGVTLVSIAGNAWSGPNDAIIKQVWVGESIPGQNSATLEMNITTVSSAKLISIRTEAARKIEIHSVSQHGGAMNARVVDSLQLPAHHTTSFGSHQLFLILVGLNRELNIDDSIPVSILIEYANHRRQTFDVEATVKKMSLSYKHVGSQKVHDHR